MENSIFRITKHKDGVFEDSIWELSGDKLKCVFPAKAKDFYLGFEVLDPKKEEILKGIIEKETLQSFF